MIKTLVTLFLGACLSFGASAQPSSCSHESTLQGRSDIIHCEPWTSSTWYTSYNDDGEKTSPTAATGPDQTSLQTNCFLGGNCLRVRCIDYTAGGCGGMLAHQYPIPGNHDEIYLRYYIRTSSNWSPENYCANASFCGTLGANVDNGGKWPGLGDVRTNADPSGQCGNGGAYSDGINCWSGRLKYRNCLGSGGANICSDGAMNTRLGWYWYVPPAVSANNQEFGPFDNQSWGTTNATCSASEINLGSTGTDATSCGKGVAGIKNNTWYRVELHIKMNTPSVADGIAEAWISEVTTSDITVATKKYSKTNMMFRLTGHDNLHVRNVWLDVHMGGEFVGPLTESYIELANLVVATQRIGAFRTSTYDFVSDPFSITIN